MKPTAKLILLTLILIPGTALAQGFSWDGDFNYVTPSGGTVHFDQRYTSSAWSEWQNAYRWSVTTYDGASVGTIAIDLASGATGTFTEITSRTTTIEIVATGETTHRIYQRGVRPNSVTGVDSYSYQAGTGFTEFTTTDNATVVFRWTNLSSDARDVINATTDWMNLMSVVMVVIGGGTVLLAFTGRVDPRAMLVLVSIGLLLVVAGLVLFTTQITVLDSF